MTAKLAIVLLLASVAVTGSLAERPFDVSTNLVAETVAWQLYWDQRMGLTKGGMSSATIQVRQESAEVLVNGGEWLVAYGYGGNQSYPISVDRPAELPNEVRSRALARFRNSVPVTVKVPDYKHSFRKISSHTSEVREKLLTCFVTEACNRESLSYYKDHTGQPIKSPQFRIAPVDPQFPVIMYYVEGVPYIGRVYFETQSLKPVYFDFNYISDDPRWRKAQLKLMDAIRAEGDLFEFKGQRLIAGRH